MSPSGLASQDHPVGAAPPTNPSLPDAGMRSATIESDPPADRSPGENESCERAAVGGHGPAPASGRLRLAVLVGLIGSVIGASVAWRHREMEQGVTALSADSVSAQHGGATSPSGDRSSALPVRVIRVGEVAAADLTRRYAGLLVADRESRLGFERGGRVVDVLVKEGDTVQAGQLLAELDQDDLDAREARIDSELRAAEAVLAEMVAGPRKQTIQAASDQVKELTARVELARVDRDRQSKMIAKKATSDSEYDAARLGFLATQSQLSAAQASLDQLREGTRDEQILSQRAKCDAIKASLREIASMRSDSRIVAPFDGFISAREIDEGAVVVAGTTVVKIVSEEMEAQVGLPPEVAASLRRGQQVRVHLRDQTMTASIDRAEPTVRRETRTRVVFATLEQRDDAPSSQPLAARGWVAGEVVELEVPSVESPAPESSPRYWLPATALTRSARGLWTAVVIPGERGEGIGERRAVELLKTDGSLVLVQGMLHRGERVVAAGQHRITAGMLLTADEAPENPVGGAQR